MNDSYIIKNAYSYFDSIREKKMKVYLNLNLYILGMRYPKEMIR